MLTIFGVLFLLSLAAIGFGYMLGRTGSPLTRTLDHLVHVSYSLTRQMEELLMATAELKAVLARIDAATNNIAEDLRLLKEKILAGMSPADVAEVQAEAEALAVKLEGIAASTEDPVPDEPV